MILGTPQRIVAMLDEHLRASTAKRQCCSVTKVAPKPSSPARRGPAALPGRPSPARKARVEIEGSFYRPTSFTLIERSGESKRYEYPTVGGGLQYEAQEVARCVEEGLTESPLMTLDESIAIMETMDTVLGFL